MSFCMKRLDISFSCVIRLSSLTLPQRLLTIKRQEGGREVGEHRAARRGANNHDRNTWLFPRQKENSDTLKKEIQICRAIKQLDYY